MIEKKVILSTLIRRYKFQLSPLSPRSIPSFQGILKPINGMHIVISKRRETIFSFYSLQKYTSLFWNNVFKRIFSFTSVYRRETNHFMPLSDFKMVCILYKLCVWRGPWDFFLFDYSFEGQSEVVKYFIFKEEIMDSFISQGTATNWGIDNFEAKQVNEFNLQWPVSICTTRWVICLLFCMFQRNLEAQMEYRLYATAARAQQLLQSHVADLGPEIESN